MKVLAVCGSLRAQSSNRAMLRAFGRVAPAGVVVTLHDLGLAARSCDRIVVVDHGRVVVEGPPREALSRFILGHVFRLDGQLVETEAGPVLAARRA